MAISFVSGGSAATTTSTTDTIAVGYPSSFVAGDLLVLWVTIRTDAQTINTPSGWDFRSSTVSSGTGPRLNLYTRTADGTEAGTFNVTATAATSIVGQTFALRGVDTTSPIVDAADSDDNTTAANITLTGATATAAGQWILCAAAGQYTSTTLRTWAAPAGMDERGDASSNESGGSNVNLFVGTEALAASGATGTRLITGSANTLRRVGRLAILREGASVYNEAGQGTAIAVASGADSLSMADAGQGVAAGVGSGADTLTAADAGQGTAAAAAGGLDTFTWSEAGQGTAAAAGSGSDVLSMADAGEGLIAAEGGGADTFSGGTVYNEAGQGTALALGAGLDTLTAGEAGGATAAAAGAGADSLTVSEGGEGLILAGAGGLDTLAAADAGQGTAGATAGGLDTFLAVETGGGLLVAIGGGLDTWGATVYGAAGRLYVPGRAATATTPGQAATLTTQGASGTMTA